MCIDGMIPLIGVLVFFDENDAILRSQGIFLVICGLEMGLKCRSTVLCNADVDEDEDK